MTTPKDIKIPYDVWYALVRYFLFGLQDRETYSSCARGIEQKWQTLYKRQLYSISKDKTISPSEREAARRAYLAEAGVPESFIWPEGWDQE